MSQSGQGFSGYSHTPLLKKLGYRTGTRTFIDPIAPYYKAIDTASHKLSGPYDFIHLFVTNHEALQQRAPQAVDNLARTGILWLSWPKKSSGVVSDLNATVVRTYGLALGLVDVKVASINDTWSGYKFVYRLKDR